MSSAKKKNVRYVKKSTASVAKPKGPKGAEEALGYHVFDYGKANNQNQYNKTFEAILGHIGCNYSQSGNIITSMRQGQRVNITPILTPTYEDEETGSTADQRTAKSRNRTLDLGYVEQLKERNKKVQLLDENIEAAYSLVWGQCTASMQAQIKTMANYATIRDSFALFDLLKEIKGNKIIAHS